MRKLKFNRYVTTASNDVYFALANDPQKKPIDGIEYIEVTSDFKRSVFIKADSLKKVDSVVKNVP